MVLLQATILEWVAIPFSRVSSTTQGLNQGLLQCRWILYLLSHQGSRATLVRPTDWPQRLGSWVWGVWEGQSLSLQERERDECSKLSPHLHPWGTFLSRGFMGGRLSPAYHQVMPSG